MPPAQQRVTWLLGHCPGTTGMSGWGLGVWVLRPTVLGSCSGAWECIGSPLYSSPLVVPVARAPLSACVPHWAHFPLRVSRPSSVALPLGDRFPLAFLRLSRARARVAAHFGISASRSHRQPPALGSLRAACCRCVIVVSCSSSRQTPPRMTPARSRLLGRRA